MAGAMKEVPTNQYIIGVHGSHPLRENEVLFATGRECVCIYVCCVCCSVYVCRVFVYVVDKVSTASMYITVGFIMCVCVCRCVEEECVCAKLKDIEGCYDRVRAEMTVASARTRTRGSVYERLLSLENALIARHEGDQTERWRAHSSLHSCF